MITNYRLLQGVSQLQTILALIADVFDDVMGLHEEEFSPTVEGNTDSITAMDSATTEPSSASEVSISPGTTSQAVTEETTAVTGGGELGITRQQPITASGVGSDRTAEIAPRTFTEATTETTAMTIGPPAKMKLLFLVDGVSGDDL